MRLICLGNTIIDVAVAVGEFPEHGGDVLARSGTVRAGGSGFNVMCAASRLGVDSVYGGMIGTGPFGDAARAALAREGIQVVQDADATIDTGWDIVITDANAERTFITVVGAEARLTAQRVARITALPGDIVYVSGYGLTAEPNRSSIRDWLDDLPESVAVVTDPGPLLSHIPTEVRDAVAARTTWWSANEREAEIMTGEANPLVAATDIAARGCGVILRLGAAGCLVAEPGARKGATPRTVPGFAVDAVDTNGAGDAHVGAFIASLLSGLDPVAAARRANAAAAFSVTKAGPATAPTSRELDRFLDARTVK